MSIEENFNKRNSKLQQKIELEIEKVKVCLLYTSRCV